MKRTLLILMIFIAIGSGFTKTLVVDLVTFNTDYNESTYKIDLFWETASESDVAGFHVYRSTSYASLGDRVNATIIMAQGSSTTGATYDFIDEPEQSGRYYYRIAEVSLSGGGETYFRPSDDSDGEADYDDFVKVFQHTEENVVGGEYYWFNDGTQDNPGDGRKVSIIITATGVSGSITVKQTNAEAAGAPNADVCPWVWEITSNLPEQASIDFFYNPEDLGGTPENSDYIGLAQYDAATQTWIWLGGTVYSANHKIRLDDALPTGIYVLYRRIFGDVSGDGYVDLDDFQIFGDVWNHTATGEFPSGSNERFFNYSKTETNGQQIIDLDDFQIFGDVWNNGTPK